MQNHILLILTAIFCYRVCLKPEYNAGEDYHNYTISTIAGHDTFIITELLHRINELPMVYSPACRVAPQQSLHPIQPIFRIYYEIRISSNNYQFLNLNWTSYSPQLMFFSQLLAVFGITNSFAAFKFIFG